MKELLQKKQLGNMLFYYIVIAQIEIYSCKSNTFTPLLMMRVL